MKILDVWVPGVPKPKGSMAHLGGGQMAQSVRGSTAWAGIIRRAVKAKIERGEAGFAARSVPVRVQCSFWVTGDDIVRERAGDVDKLARNVLDALTRDERRDYPGVYVDDVQVIDVRGSRFLVDGLLFDGAAPGAHIQAYALAPAHVEALAGQAAIRALYAFREATDPHFRHRDGASLGHDCFELDCGPV